VRSTPEDGSAGSTAAVAMKGSKMVRMFRLFIVDVGRACVECKLRWEAGKQWWESHGHYRRYVRWC
jgi:hypothetical protein